MNDLYEDDPIVEQLFTAKQEKKNKPIKCGYCPNEFLGRNYLHTKELVDRHEKKKHPEQLRTLLGI